MNHGNLITQLVVGEPRAVPIGRPVEKRLVAATQTALRWKQGKWIAPAPGLLTRLRDALGRRAARAIVIRRGAPLEQEPPRKPEMPVPMRPAPPATTVRGSGGRLAIWAVATGAAVCAVTAVLVLTAVQHQGWLPEAAPAARAHSTDLPIPHAGSGQQVRVVEENYEPASARETVDTEPAPQEAANNAVRALPEQKGPLPIAASPLQQAVTRPAAQLPLAPPKPPASLSSPTAVRLKMAASAPIAKPAGGPPTAAVSARPAASGSGHAAPAVLYDTETTHATRQPVAAPAQTIPATSGVAQPGIVQPVTATGTTAAQMLSSQPAGEVPSFRASSTAPAARTAGLVAITPDGKMAVFTNPATKLPQPFKVGDRLPSGETLRSIDAKEGKVVTTSKDYSLE
jgi:hypothetical protein